MQFVAGGINGNYLLRLHEQALKNASLLNAALAYAHNEFRLVTDARDAGMPVRFYGRCDATLPIDLKLLEVFINARSPDLECRLIGRTFHPKVIWWEGFGAYIGSANLTTSAWFHNIEAGLFVDVDELVQFNLNEELRHFFDEIHRHSSPLTSQLLDHMKVQSRLNSEVEEATKKAARAFDRFEIPEGKPLTKVSRASQLEKRRRKFIDEWIETLKYLGDIGSRVSQDEFRPSWIGRHVPRGVQADQFLHAYYYDKVRDGNKSKHNEFHESNSPRAEDALVAAMTWWKQLSQPPHQEDITIDDWAPFLRQKLSKTKVSSLTEEEFVQVCERIHALREHAPRVSSSTLSIPRELSPMAKPDRIKWLGRWLYNQRSASNGTVLETIEFVLYGGPLIEVPRRIWTATSPEEGIKISQFGIGTLGELVGWALPDELPPRNNRTSKALRALGYNVTIHSE